MKINKDTLWTYAIVISMILYLMLMSIWANGQMVKDSIISFKKINDNKVQRHKQLLEDIENPEKYQMIYFDKAIIDKKKHKIYLYSSYDLYWAEELGVGWQITIPHKKQNKTYEKINYYRLQRIQLHR